jgi:glycosyltransferase involved in cell wall biosynthesis
MTRRILHVVGAMRRGGIQSWLMHLLRTIDRQNYHLDFLVHSPQPCAYDQEVRDLGSSVLHCPQTGNPWQYARDFARTLRTQAPYDVVHSHVYSFTGLVLRLAARQRVPLRIAHCHNNRRVVETARGVVRHCQLRLMKSWIRKYAMVKIAASGDAAEDLFGPAWNLDPAVRVIHCGLDLTAFKIAPDRAALRARLGLAPDDRVIGHVGRFVPQKNHRFLIEVAAEAIKRDDRVRLLLVGDGPLRPEIERHAAALGIAGRVLFVGERDDVPEVMSAMDGLLFPSLHEGLGLVLVEAQAAGLSCLIADRVPREADVVPGLVYRLPLEEAPAGWAERLIEISTARRVGRAEALAAVVASPFNIAGSVRQISRIYDGVL